MTDSPSPEPVANIKSGDSPSPHEPAMEAFLIRLAHYNSGPLSQEIIEIINWLASRELHRRAAASPSIQSSPPQEIRSDVLGDLNTDEDFGRIGRRMCELDSAGMCRVLPEDDYLRLVADAVRRLSQSRVTK